MQFEESTGSGPTMTARGVAYFLGGEEVCTPCKAGFFEQEGEMGFWYKTKREVMMMPRFFTPGFVSSKCNASQELPGPTMWRRHAPR